ASPGVRNLMTIAHVASGRPIAAIEAELEGGGYGTLKKLTVEAVNEMLAPLQRRYREYMDDRAGLDAVLARGAERARESAGPTLRRAQAARGVGRRAESSSGSSTASACPARPRPARPPARPSRRAPRPSTRCGRAASRRPPSTA